ncbi:MAG: sigma-70 family RNA polymerase sigma factor [Anaerohalosphaera sp.]|nr:sigma-70 family RNA polymerase sigma factor [Anaerohalosphaera sp.]
MSTQTTSDTELIKAALQGRHDAFARLIDKYRSLVCAITYSATTDLDTSDDLAQKAFITAWKDLSQLKDLTKFRPWLCTVTRNIISSSFRKQGRDPISHAAHLDNIPESVAPDCQPDRNLISAEERALVANAMQNIPENYREPLVLFYWQNQSIKQVALQLELTDETVKQRLHRGRKLLKEQVTTVVERTLTRAAPGKAFTTSVIVAISAMAVTHSAQAATTATAAKTSALSITSSTIATKIIATAAAIALAIGIVATYKTVTADSNSPQLTANQQPRTETSPIAPTPEPGIETKTLSDSSKAAAPSTETGSANIAASPDTQQSAPPEVPANQTAAVDPTDKDPDPFMGLTGIVIDKTTSKPVANAQVYMRTPKGKITVKTDPAGKFKVTMNVAGIKGIPDKFEHRISIIAKNYTTRQVSIHLTKNEVGDGGKIELTPGTKVAGTVFDQNNEPIIGAQVATFQFTNHPVTTDADGKFIIDGLDPGWAAYSLHAEHPEYPSATVRFSPVKAGETLYTDIVMTKGITVHGQLTNSNGDPVSGVSVGNTTSRCMWNLIEDKTDVQGKYTLKNVPPGEFVIWAINNKYAPYVENLTLDSDLKEKQIDIQLLDPNPLHGKVVDSMDNPVPDVFASIREYKGVSNLSNHRVKTDSQGLFTIPNAPAEGKLILELFAKHVPNTNPELEMGQELYTITVDRAGKIYGKVIAEKTQLPIEHFMVKMTFTKVGISKGGYAATWNRQGHTFNSKQGHFDTGTENIAIGSDYLMTVYADGFEPLMIDPVTVQPASGTPERTVFGLIPATLIKGTVTDTQSNPIPQARVRWVTSNDDRHWDDRDTAITDAKGKFTITNMENIARAVYVSAKTYSPVVFAPDELPNNDEGSLEFKLEKAPQVFGIVTDKDGKPVVGADIRTYSQLNSKLANVGSLPRPQTTTNVDGFYELFDLPTGETTIIVSWPNDMSSNLTQKEITLKAGQELELNLSPDLRLTISGAIPAQVRHSDNIKITAYYYNPDWIPGRNWDYLSYPVKSEINTDGTFSCSNLKPGTYYLSLRTDDRQQDITDIFELTADETINNLTFKPTASALNIRAIDAVTGKAIPYVNFDLHNDLEFQFYSKKLTSPQSRAMNTGPEAEATFDSLPAGSYMIKSYAIGYLEGESEFVELFDSETQTITVQLTPCSAAQFKLSETLSEDIETEAYILCTITNNTTGEIIPGNMEESKHHVRVITETNTHWSATAKNLPAGTYTIDYSLYAVKDGRYSHHLPPILTGSETVQLTTGHTKTIKISTDSSL